MILVHLKETEYIVIIVWEVHWLQTHTYIMCQY